MKLLNTVSVNLSIWDIFLQSAKIFAGYLLYLVGGAIMFVFFEEKNEVKFKGLKPIKQT